MIKITRVIVAMNAPPAFGMAAGTWSPPSQARKPAPAPMISAKTVPIASQTGTTPAPVSVMDLDERLVVAERVHLTHVRGFLDEANQELACPFQGSGQIRGGEPRFDRTQHAGHMPLPSFTPTSKPRHGLMWRADSSTDDGPS